MNEKELHQKLKLTYHWTDKTYSKLRRKYGSSAATTYVWLRENAQPAWFAWQVMLEQISELGIEYPGGLKCTLFRKRRLS